MKVHSNWSYNPYRPFFFDVGDIYICRVVPKPNGIHFEWLSNGEEKYNVYYRKRGREDIFEFIFAGDTVKTEFDIDGLEEKTDYEFYVCDAKDENKKSRVRLAKTGGFDECNGVIVNYLHPDDLAYSFSGRFLCSPSMVRHPDGFLLASMDLYAAAHPQNLTLIFRSDDDGKTWHYVSELFPCFWGKMFVHNGDVYMFGSSTEYGDMLIGKSTDGGKTFCTPTVLLRGGNGKNGEAGVHRNPMQVVSHKGRLWYTLEWGAWARGYHAPMAISAPLDSDLLDPDSWELTPPIKYDPNWKGVPKGNSVGCIEGSLVVGKDGKFYNFMRYDMVHLTPDHGMAILFEVDAENPGSPLKFAKTVGFMAHNAKCEIQYDPVSDKYITICVRFEESSTLDFYRRALLSFMCSDDLEHWTLVYDIFDKRHMDTKYVGFQYVTFIIEGDDINFLCRTAINGADDFHNSNHSTFHTIKNFRQYLK